MLFSHFWNASRHLCTPKKVIKFRAEVILKTMDYPWRHDVYKDLQEVVKKQKIWTKKRLYNEFKRHRNRISILTRNSKANHYQNIFQEHKQNMLKTWECYQITLQITLRITLPTQVSYKSIRKNLLLNSDIAWWSWRHNQNIKPKKINWSKQYSN